MPLYINADLTRNADVTQRKRVSGKSKLQANPMKIKSHHFQAIIQTNHIPRVTPIEAY